ncbi:hypothetical protein PRK78_002956 [Emydomyces testavorans]|uniref:Uncharacterized protein n=1 Tax=Emydomyces testavorans TaxID=2070801 RepID=A0AAF0DF86_9EURO|nr:hypothetical protein PRK78_002956 [Emydomyces testavorans]
MPWNELLDSFSGAFSAPSVPDDPFFQSRDIPVRPHLRIAPLRNPIPPGSRRIPSPLEPATIAARESSTLKLLNGNPPTELPTLKDFLKAARRDNDLLHIPGVLSNSEQPPRTILPAFISLSAVEKLPYSSFSDETLRKRRRLDTAGENFGELLLPIPKVQKEIPQRRPFGPLPVLNELKEPPPNAALFPPIEENRPPLVLNPQEKNATLPAEHTVSDQAGERRAQRIEDLIELNPEDEGNLVRQEKEHRSLRAWETDQPEPKSYTKQITEGKGKLLSQENLTKPKKKLRRWTEQETHDLLRGVVRCGVGNWTTILAQSDLKFNKRTATNLKDRFRVCCPWAYESGEMPSPDDIQARLAGSINNAQSGLVGKILLPDPRATRSGPEFSKGPVSGSNLSTKSNCAAVESCGSTAPDAQQRRSKLKEKRSSGLNGSQELSDKSKSTLMSLGLQDPDITVKSSRRHRRPFTPVEDEALLKGYAVYGFQWTLIREDKHLNLMHRKATDLRDRFRTKFPNVYRKGGFVKNIEISIRDGRSLAVAGNEMKEGLTSVNENRLNNDSQNENIPTATSGTTAVPIDPAMSPPAPPSSLPDPPNVPVTPMFPYSIDDNGPSTEESTYALRWPENTLPPLAWDELG